MYQINACKRVGSYISLPTRRCRLPPYLHTYLPVVFHCQTHAASDTQGIRILQIVRVKSSATPEQMRSNIYAQNYVLNKTGSGVSAQTRALKNRCAQICSQNMRSQICAGNQHVLRLLIWLPRASFADAHVFEQFEFVDNAR